MDNTTPKKLPALLVSKEGKLPQKQGISSNDNKETVQRNDLLLNQILRQNKETLLYLKQVIDKPRKSSKEEDDDSLKNRTIFGDLSQFAVEFKNELLDTAGYLTGTNFLRKNKKEINKPKSTDNKLQVDKNEIVQEQNPKLAAQPSPMQQAVATLQNKNDLTQTTLENLGIQQPKFNGQQNNVPILNNLEMLFKNMLGEVILIRKFVEGTLSINTYKGGSKYIERDFQKQKVIHIDEDTAKQNKDTVRIERNITTPRETITKSQLGVQDNKGIDLASNDESKDDRYIEKLSTAIADKLSAVLEDVGGSFSPSLDMPDRTKSDGGKKAEPKKSSKSVPSSAGMGSTGKIGNWLARIGVLAEGGLAAYEVGQIEEQKDKGQIDTKSANEQQAKAVGRLAGAGTLGTIGLGFGTALGGPVGGIAGGVIGAVAGGFLGGEAAEKLANTIQNLSFFSNENKNNLPTPTSQSNGSNLKDITEENIATKIEDMVGKMLTPISSTQVIDNSSNQMLGVAPEIRNNYSPWMRQQMKNMVGENM